jgi:fibronectin type 3 domain-containing protein
VNSCGSFSRLNSHPTGTTVYTDTSIVDGTSYCYAVTAVNTSGAESSYSNVVSNLKIPSS